jgi:peroxiredoxin
MKRSIIFSTLLLFAFGSIAQDAKDILRKSYQKCQSIQDGYYEMTSYLKNSTTLDTSNFSVKCYFKKLTNDTIYPVAFYSQFFYKDNYDGGIMYTGHEFISLPINDSCAEIMSNTLWPKEVTDNINGYTYYDLISDPENSIMTQELDYNDSTQEFRLIGDEVIGGFLSHHIKVVHKPKKDSLTHLIVLKMECDYWINKEDFIPVQNSIAHTVQIGYDTLLLYDKCVLNKYEINILIPDSVLSLNAIPSYYTLKDYVPDKGKELLAKDMMAPSFTLPSLTDEPISLNSLKGKLVLVDFFFKGCYPCMQAVPSLQALHEKYKDRGLRIIGIDPYDKKEHGIAAFLAKRGVTYTVLLGGKDVAKDYHVSGYPTIYLIDRQGKIIHSQVGYGKVTEAELEKIIEKSL